MNTETMIGLVVEDVEEDNEQLEDVEEHGANRETLQWLAVTPELNIWGKWNITHHTHTLWCDVPAHG